jgi:hypothetical protein
MRRYLLIALTATASLFVATSEPQAVVVDMNHTGTSIAYNSSDQSGYVGVALVPGTRSNLATASIPTVTTSGSCSDPALSADLILPSTGICAHGGNVMHGNETFTLTWDPHPSRYFETTRAYVQQFLSDVASGSGTLTSPYAVTSQYTDGTGRAGNASLYAGGCIDYGSVAGSACKFGATTGAATGNDYPTSGGCTVTGSNQFHQQLSGAFNSVPNDICLTDAQLQSELSTMITQTGMLTPTHLKPGYTPLVVLLTPPGVETCLDSGSKLCSANGGSTAQFCSYHSQVNVGGIDVAYVVQPWTASWTTSTGCDEPDAAAMPGQNPPPPPTALATDVGARLVSPLSQSQLAAIVNPSLSGWFALNGSEINDNGCVPFNQGRDSVTVGGTSYLLQREFNNAGVIESDPNAPSCAPSVILSPSFVVPSAVNQGDQVQFDGSTSASTLIVPNAGYTWNFGDGTMPATGPSVVHSYTTGGTYSVKLSVTDRGGNVQSLSQTIQVLGPNGLPVPTPTSGTTSSGGAGSTPPGGATTPPSPTPVLHVHLQLLPQSLRTALHSGIAVQVSSNEAANGIAQVSISRSTAKRAHIKAGRGPSVVIGTGTVSAIKGGTVQLHLVLSRAMAAKLKQLKHVILTVRLALVAAAGDRIALDAAGRY